MSCSNASHGPDQGLDEGEGGGISLTSGYIQTVNGPRQPDQLGFTLPHEHVFVSIWEQDGAGSIVQTDDEGLLGEELRGFKDRGGTCLVDQTPRGAGRRPTALRALADAIGIAVVMGCGWYREHFYPPEDALPKRPVNMLADLLTAEILVGVDGTAIKPGIIGEIGASQNWVSPLEERVLRAAARAQTRTGLALGTHAVFADAATQQLDILEEEKVDPTRIVVGHCDLQPNTVACLQLLERGVYVAFDNIGLQRGDHEERLARFICDLLDRGYASQILLSHDVGQVSELRTNGGPGFVYLSDSFLPRLRAHGVSDEDVTLLTSDNPRRLLTVSAA